MIKDAPGSKRSPAHLPGSPAPKTWNNSEKCSDKPRPKPTAAATLETLREVMWKHVGILRNGKELKAAVDALDAMEIPQAEKEGRYEHELHNLHKLALLLSRSALAREESRGSHYRSDFPYRDDDRFRKHSAVSKNHEVTFES
jgi:L-aspartate oxidase